MGGKSSREKSNYRLEECAPTPSAGPDTAAPLAGIVVAERELNNTKTTRSTFIPGDLSELPMLSKGLLLRKGTASGKDQRETISINRNRINPLTNIVFRMYKTNM